MLNLFKLALNPVALAVRLALYANHASHGTLPYPIKGARFTWLIPFLDADGDPADPTSLDTEFSLDNGAFADAAEEVTLASGSRGVGMLTSSGAETNGSLIALYVGCATAKPTLLTARIPGLVTLSTGTLSAGSAGGGTLGTILGYDLTGCFIKTTGGTGGGGTGGANNQARRIVSYVVATGAFTVAVNWETTPDNTTTYAVLLPEGAVLPLDPTARANLQRGSSAIVLGACIAGSTTTNIVTGLTEVTNDHYNGRVITFTSGALLGQSSAISDYVGSTKALTVVALTEAPADTDTFVIS